MYVGTMRVEYQNVATNLYICRKYEAWYGMGTSEHIGGFFQCVWNGGGYV